MKTILLHIYRLLLRTIKPNSGLTPLSFNPFVNWLFQGMGDPAAAKTASGEVIEVDPNDYHGRILWLFGSNDFKVSRTVNALLRRGDIFLDIGANYGSIGLAAAHVVGPTSSVHLFEPQSTLAKRLRAAIDRARLTKVTVHEVALWDADGDLELKIPQNHSGMATVVRSAIDEPDWRSVSIKAATTSTYVSKIVLDRDFGVKIDVEGAEPTILKQIVKFPKLRFVVFEGCNNSEALFDIFTSAGFEIFGLRKTYLFPSVEHVADMRSWNQFHDFVAVPGPVALERRTLSPKLLAAIVEKTKP